jgi:hypothetical protein
MDDILLYQTSDAVFADSAVSALQDAGISCCQRGTGWSVEHSSARHLLNQGIYIFIHDENDYPRANKIIIAMGGFVEPRLRIPHSHLALVILGVVLAVAAYFIAGMTQW